MSISIQTNYPSLVTQHTLNQTNNDLTVNMERLSTGYRINSAQDDAAGLQIANRLEAQSRGMDVAMRNSQDAISMMQTAEGAMDEMTNIAYRMNDLATQAANGSNSAEDQAALNSEFQALGQQLVDMQDSTKFGGQSLLGEDGAFGSAITFQTGASSTDTLEVDVSDGVDAIATDAVALAGLDITNAANAATAMNALTGDPTDDTDSGFIGTLGQARSSFGAQINNLEHNITNLANMVENVEASKGRIMDTDFAAESGEMSKNQMLMQSGSQMLQVANMSPQYAVSMLN